MFFLHMHRSSNSIEENRRHFGIRFPVKIIRGNFRNIMWEFFFKIIFWGIYRRLFSQDTCTRTTNWANPATSMVILELLLKKCFVRSQWPLTSKIWSVHPWVQGDVCAKLEIISPTGFLRYCLHKNGTHRQMYGQPCRWSRRTKKHLLTSVWCGLFLYITAPADTLFEHYCHQVSISGISMKLSKV